MGESASAGSKEGNNKNNNNNNSNSSDKDNNKNNNNSNDGHDNDNNNENDNHLADVENDGSDEDDENTQDDEDVILKSGEERRGDASGGGDAVEGKGNVKGNMDEEGLEKEGTVSDETLLHEISEDEVDWGKTKRRVKQKTGDEVQTNMGDEKTITMHVVPNHLSQITLALPYVTVPTKFPVDYLAEYIIAKLSQKVEIEGPEEETAKLKITPIRSKLRLFCGAENIIYDAREEHPRVTEDGDKNIPLETIQEVIQRNGFGDEIIRSNKTPDRTPKVVTITYNW